MEEMDAITRRILDYDELNEEAVYLQIWASQKVNNIYQAKFNYNLFLAKYLETMGELYPMSFDQFKHSLCRNYLKQQFVFSSLVEHQKSAILLNRDTRQTFYLCHGFNL
jgi:hypothetical protein